MSGDTTSAIVYADKTVLRVTGIQVKGLDTRTLEALLTERFSSLVRVIGVTGNSIEMDIYGIAEEDILRDEDGVIQTIALADGISLSDLAKMESAKRIHEVPLEEIPACLGCAAERWVRQ